MSYGGVRTGKPESDRAVKLLIHRLCMNKNSTRRGKTGTDDGISSHKFRPVGVFLLRIGMYLYY